jgi:hypothetical protein
MALDDLSKLEVDALKHASEHGLFHRCMQEESVDGLKITVGAIEQTIFDKGKATADTLERLEAKVDRLVDEMENIKHGGTNVTIKANGILGSMKLGDVLQVLWDSPSTTIKTAESTLKRVVEVCKSLVWVFGAILVLMYTIINILHLPTP